MRYLDAFSRAVDCHPDKAALITREENEVSYSALDAKSTALAAGLDAYARGKRIGTLAVNSELAVTSMIAGQKRGPGTTQLPFRNSLSNLVAMIETTETAGIVFDDANADTALSLLETTSLDVAVHAGSDTISHDRVIAFDDLIDNAETEGYTSSGEDEYGCFFTSGTINEPKAVNFDQEQMWLGSTQVIMEMSITETDVGLMSAPWYHMFGTDAWILPHLQAGATLVVQSGFDPEEALQLIEKFNITGVPAVPTQLNAMLRVLEDKSYDVSSLTKIRTGGAVVPAPLIERVEKELTEGVFNTYGCTEAGPNMTFAHPRVQEDHPGTIGKKSYMWDLRVVEPAPPTEEPDVTAEVGPGGTGEIMVRGPGMSDGYMGDPDTLSPVIVDGWLRTKDIAAVDEEGYLVVIDRVDNMLNSGGENIYPQEVERVLEIHPAVLDVAVVGLPDEEWGHRIAAVIQSDKPVSDEELDTHCQSSDQLADFKRPRVYTITNKPLPRTETGTLQRSVVKEEYF